MGFCDDSVVKNPPTNAGDMGLIPGSGRSHGEENGNPLWYCLGNPMDRRAWQATVHRVTKGRAHLNQLSLHKHTYMYLFFFKLFSHLGYYRVSSRVPCAIYSRFFLVIYFKYSSVYISIPNSQSTPPADFRWTIQGSLSGKGHLS